MIIALGTTPALQRTMTFTALAIGDVNRATRVYEYASGKSINVARVIHTMGQPCVATGFLGGARGQLCGDDLDRVGIAHDFVPASANTRTSITVIDQKGATATELVEEASPVGPEEVERLLKTLSALLARAGVLVLSGKLAPGCGEDFYARCCQLANLAGVATVVDATGEPLRLTLAHRPLVVKPNRDELAATLGRPIETGEQLTDAAGEIISMGAQWVALTHGVEDTIISNGGEYWRIPTPRVKVVSAIGSGDAFAAGVAIGIASGDSIPQACIRGVACGAANAMSECAGFVDPVEIDRLQKQIKVERIGKSYL